MSLRLSVVSPPMVPCGSDASVPDGCIENRISDDLLRDETASLSHRLRTTVCTSLAWIGLEFVGAVNMTGVWWDSTRDSLAEIHVIATEDETMFARHTLALLEKNRGVKLRT